MTGSVINLRRERKRRARVAEDATAAANRISFGTPRALRQHAAAEVERQAVRLDAHRLSPDRLPSRRETPPDSEP